MKKEIETQPKSVLVYIGYFIAFVIFMAGIIYGVMTSDFTKIKSYDQIKKEEKSPKMTKAKQHIASQRKYSVAIEEQDNGMLNLGDFTMNLSDGSKLVANISVDYKNNNYFSSEKEDMISKSGVLRNAVIKAIQGSNIHRNNDDVKEKIKENLNKYLTDGEVKHIYFNRFIIQ